MLNCSKIKPTFCRETYNVLQSVPPNSRLPRTSERDFENRDFADVVIVKDLETKSS